MNRQLINNNLLSLPTEIFSLIFDFLTQSEIIQLRLVSSLWQRKYPLLIHNILYFSNKNQPTFKVSDLSEGYTGRELDGRSIIRLIYVNPEELMKTEENNLLKYLPPMGLSEVHSLAISLSSQSPSYGQFINLILKLLETYKFKKLTSLYLHNVEVNQSLLNFSSKQSYLKCLYFNNCSWSEDLTLFQRKLISLKDFRVLCKICIKFNEHHANFEMPDTLEYLILDFKRGNSLFQPHMYIYAEGCRGLKSIETKCYFLDQRLCLFVPEVVCQTTKHSKSKRCLEIVRLNDKIISELNIENRHAILTGIAMNQRFED